MPDKKEAFDQFKYQANWQKDNMLNVSAKYRKDFVLEFREACKKLGIGTSDVIRRAMEETIERASKQ